MWWLFCLLPHGSEALLSGKETRAPLSARPGKPRGFVLCVRGLVARKEIRLVFSVQRHPYPENQPLLRSELQEGRLQDSTDRISAQLDETRPSAVPLKHVDLNLGR